MPSSYRLPSLTYLSHSPHMLLWGLSAVVRVGASSFQVERLLEGVDSCVYLLDYTKLKTQEEADLLKRLRNINPQLFSRLSQRLFFVVNKADTVCERKREGMRDEEGGRGVERERRRERMCRVHMSVGAGCVQLPSQ